MIYLETLSIGDSINLFSEGQCRPFCRDNQFPLYTMLDEHVWYISIFDVQFLTVYLHRVFFHSSIWINSIHLQISKAQFMFTLNSAIRRKQFYGRDLWICNGDFIHKNSTVWNKTKIRKTRQQIDQGSLFLMDSTFGLKIIYSAKKTHYNMHGIFLSDCESDQKISLYY